jgi:hypothetical protein
MSFVRRFTSQPSAAVISQIEGVVIVDLPTPGPIEGVSTGVVGVVGEFADMTYAVSVDGSGNVTTKCQPVEIISATDMVNKVGGWDETLGDFGGDDGNGYAMVASKRFSRLILAPINLASSKGVRLYRELPTNTAAAMPIVPMQAASVAAGTEFKSGTDRVRLAKAVSFSAAGQIAFGTDGSHGVYATTTGTFTSASAKFLTAGVQVGDALVLGTIGGSGSPGTYRIVAVSSETSLDVEALDGSALSWASTSSLPWRIHPASAFDTGAAHTFSQDAGYLIPARNLVQAIASGTAPFAPAVAAAAGTATAWSPLSGLRMAFNPTSGLSYSAVQAPNAVTSGSLETLYASAIDAMLADAAPMRDVSVMVAARTSTAIRGYLKQHVLSASSQGRGRMAVIAPSVTTVSEPTVLGDAAPGVGATRDERVIYCWPAVRTQVSEASGFSIKTATGGYTTDGILDQRADIFMASILSNLAAERNPGQATDPVPTCLAGVLDFQRGNLPAFTMTDYILFKQYGIAAIRFDRTAGKVFQSGITTSLTTGQRNINRRRMADEVQDSLAAIYEKFSKLPLSNQLKDSIDAETVAYLETLLSPNNPAAQRIEAYSIDSKSGNTPQLNAQGIYVVIVKVRMLATADDIVLQAEVGPTVTVTAA